MKCIYVKKSERDGIRELIKRNSGLSEIILVTVIDSFSVTKSTIIIAKLLLHVRVLQKEKELLIDSF